MIAIYLDFQIIEFVQIILFKKQHNFKQEDTVLLLKILKSLTHRILSNKFD